MLPVSRLIIRISSENLRFIFGSFGFQSTESSEEPALSLKSLFFTASQILGLQAVAE